VWVATPSPYDSFIHNTSPVYPGAQGGNKMATNKKPANTLRCGNIKATIWENTSEKGPFFSTTFSRPFKDQSRMWHNGTSFGLNDLEALVTVAHEAKEWIATHVLKR
jgi:hypothetical protein